MTVVLTKLSDICKSQDIQYNRNNYIGKKFRFESDKNNKVLTYIPCNIAPKATKAKNNLQSWGNNKCTLGSSHYPLKFLQASLKTGTSGRCWYRNWSSMVLVKWPPEDPQCYCIDLPRWSKWLLAHKYKSLLSLQANEYQRMSETMCSIQPQKAVSVSFLPSPPKQIIIIVIRDRI